MALGLALCLFKKFVSILLLSLVGPDFLHGAENMAIFQLLSFSACGSPLETDYLNVLGPHK